MFRYVHAVKLFQKVICHVIVEAITKSKSWQSQGLCKVKALALRETDKLDQGEERSCFWHGRLRTTGCRVQAVL